MAKTNITGQLVAFPEKTTDCFSLPLHFIDADLQHVLKTYSSYMPGLIFHSLLLGSRPSEDIV